MTKPLSNDQWGWLVGFVIAYNQFSTNHLIKHKVSMGQSKDPNNPTHHTGCNPATPQAIPAFSVCDCHCPQANGTNATVGDGEPINSAEVLPDEARGQVLAQG